MWRHLWQYFFAGLLLVVPAWATFLILATLFRTLDQMLIDLFGSRVDMKIPGLGLVLLLLLILLVGAIATHVFGQRLVEKTEQWLERIPIVRSVYLTLKGMTDLFKFRSRFGRSPVVAFPFPRNGLWALGFVMGTAPLALQVAPMTKLLMVFVPTAIHPFTGYLAFVPQEEVRPIDVSPEDAMKLEFSAGFFKPGKEWLRPPAGVQ